MTLFNINQREKSITSYTITGQHDRLDENNYPVIDDNKSDKVYAKCVVSDLPKRSNLLSDKSYNYYILTYANKEPFNPVKKYSIQSKRDNAFIDKTCKQTTVFTSVSSYVFKKYLVFLQTGNETLLKDIMRDI